MNAEIYYFSGTGNSFAVAGDIAQRINGKLIPVAAFLKEEKVSTNADVLGFVFPVYDFKAPIIMYDFVRKFDSLQSKYLFAIGTYGFTPSKALDKFDIEIGKKQGKLSSGFLIQMPKSGFGKKLDKEEEEELFKKWDKRIEEIAGIIEEKKIVKFDKLNAFVHLILKGVIFQEFSAMIPLLWFVLRHGWVALTFKTNDDCSGCGLCVKVCPVGNIELINGKPVWGDNCASCFGCLHWCPKEAIVTGEFAGIGKRYHHPKVSFKNMMNQRNWKS